MMPTPNEILANAVANANACRRVLAAELDSGNDAGYIGLAVENELVALYRATLPFRGRIDDIDLHSDRALAEGNLFELLAACQAAGEQLKATAPSDIVDEYTRLRIAADQKASAPEARSFLLSMDDINVRCDAMLQGEISSDDCHPLVDALEALERLGDIEGCRAIKAVFEHVIEKAWVIAEGAKHFRGQAVRMAA